MISIVLYGRNDSYGYNLHKRAALGINCMAEVLSHPADEILFVDYNSPDDHPTFPEAIGDTLTDKAVEKLRILRIRPAVHERFAKRTHLKALEPIARNAAVRRMNPENRWVLSTNTDMIFVPRTAATLSEVAADLPDAFYHLPRFELPESLWEGFDRRAPARVIERMKELGRTMFLNEVVSGVDFIRYDGPGDFQLVLRSDLLRINGFDEAMLLGWHVDSNIAKRLSLIHGAPGDLLETFFGYHCDHTRQVTPAHQPQAVSNDSRVFVDGVTEPVLSSQAETWGCASDQLEEIRLTRSAHHVYVQGLRGVLTGEWSTPAKAAYIPSSFDQTTYDARHVLPFVADLLVSLPLTTSVAWVGARADTFRLFCDFWRQCGFAGRILIPDWAVLLLQVEPQRVQTVSSAEGFAEANLLIVDFGNPAHSTLVVNDRVHDLTVSAVSERLVGQAFSELIAAERRRLAADLAPRRFVCVDAIHNRHEWIVVREIAAAATPFSSRLRHGFVKRRSEDYADQEIEKLDETANPAAGRNLIDAMLVGEGGQRIDDGIHAAFGRRGVVLQGPHKLLPGGDYEFMVRIRPHSLFSLFGLIRPVIVDVTAGAERLLQRRMYFFLGASMRIPFTVTEALENEQPIYLRLFRGRYIDFVVTDVRLTRLSASAAASESRTELRNLLEGRTSPGEATR